MFNHVIEKLGFLHITATRDLAVNLPHSARGTLTELLGMTHCKQLCQPIILWHKYVSITQQMFEEWGQKELPPLMSNIDAAYMKWQVLDYKTEVENQLRYFDVDRQEDKLMSTSALFLSAGRPSERDPHVTIYPFTFIPHNWY